MDQMREANERLIIAAVHAQNLVGRGHTKRPSQAKTELDDRPEPSCGTRTNVSPPPPHRPTRWRWRPGDAKRSIASCPAGCSPCRMTSVGVWRSICTTRRRSAWPRLLMNLDMVERATKALDPRSRQALAESRSLAQECCREVRTLCVPAAPALARRDGPVVGRALVRGRILETQRHSCGRSTWARSDDCRGPIETALFRVVQESLTNVHRHASTTTATIRLTATTDAIVLEIQDQGRGLRRSGHTRRRCADATRAWGSRGCASVSVSLGGTSRSSSRTAVRRFASACP